MAFVSSAPLTLYPSSRLTFASARRPGRPLFVSRPSLAVRCTASTPDLPESRALYPPDSLARAQTAFPTAALSTRRSDGSRISLLVRLALIALLTGAAACLILFPANVAKLVTDASTYASTLSPLRAALLLFCLNFTTVLFCFPANMGLMIFAGALLGPLNAFLALFLSKLFAASAAFALARTLLYKRAHAWLDEHPRLQKVLESGAEGGWRFVLLMRLSPFPGFMLNYLLSVTNVSYLQYILATAAGIAPSVLNLVLIGATAKDVGVGVGGGAVAGGWLSLALKALCIASMITIMVVVTRKARQAFAEVDAETDSQPAPSSSKA